MTIPNTTIIGEQETYRHFEEVISFSSDHLTIHARGQSDNSIFSGEMVSAYASRSYCVEAKYRIPAERYAWPAFWVYGAAAGGGGSEIDFEQPIAQWQGVHDVTMHNHPYEGENIQIFTSLFTTNYMNYSSPQFDASAAPHAYTICYDDKAGVLSRYIDGALIYSANYKWNRSLLAKAPGPDAAFIVNLAVGDNGNWVGSTPDPASFAADMDVYSIDYYAP